MIQKKTKKTSEPVLHAFILNDGTVIPAAKIKILKDFGLIPTSETPEDQQINLQGRNKSGKIHINEINLLNQPESHLTKNEQKKQSTQKTEQKTVRNLKN